MINVTRSSLPPFEEYCDEIRELWDSRWLTNMGSKHQALEQALRDYLGCEHLALCTNGHLALENLLEAFGLKGEILTTPFTFASTTHAIVRCGCRPVFCDIDPVNFTLDPRELERRLTKDTVAIVPVHVYGNLCDVEAIADFSKRHGLPVMCSRISRSRLRLEREWPSWAFPVAARAPSLNSSPACMNPGKGRSCWMAFL